MEKTNVVVSCEVTINYALKRLSKLDGKDQLAFRSEFEEWINAIENENKNYDVLCINKINL